jgi:SpoVK/Ycf46/Vps4 family AAA+-type ATPase
VTEVNEMLQGMERFAGIFICTTNLFEDLDEAALRRFTFKIRFRPLTAPSSASACSSPRRWRATPRG